MLWNFFREAPEMFLLSATVSIPPLFELSESFRALFTFPSFINRANRIAFALDLYSHYHKKLLVGDFNTDVSDVLSIFLYQHDLENPVKDKTCFKNANNPSTIDLFLTNSSLAFENTTATFTGLSDCHKLVLTVLKTTFLKK